MSRAGRQKIPVLKMDLAQELKLLIQSEVDLGKIVEKLREDKNAGVSQEDVMAILRGLRNDSKNAHEEDRILEVMDCVVGFCSPHNQIW